MCDIGRYEFGSLRAPERLGSIKRRISDIAAGPTRPAAPEGAHKQFEDLLWPEGINAVHEAIRALAVRSDSRLAFVLSPFLTCEEAYLLALYARTQSPEALLALGKVPVVGEDETFKSGFTIRAERCPNRRGVEEILRHFQGSVVSWDEIVKRVETGDVHGAYVTANYPDPWIEESEAAKFDRLSLLIVHDILPSPLARRAHFVVPGAASAEKDGSYVNCAGLIQMTEWAVRPPEGAHSDGQTLSDLLGRRGLYQAAGVLAELACVVPFFARASGGVPREGLDLVLGHEKHPSTMVLGTVTHPAPTFRSAASPLLEVEPRAEVQ